MNSLLNTINVMCRAENNHVCMDDGEDEVEDMVLQQTENIWFSYGMKLLSS